MNTSAKNFLVIKQDLIAKERVVKVVREWVVKNKKLFWKYEVSSFYKTYVLKVANLPEPSVKDITLTGNRLLNDIHKTQISEAIIKVCSKAEFLTDSSIDIQINYADGDVITDVI